eukprot:Tamp_18543.p1 GENE.Tamp_18543~~Tamp_18543.p1  ORF type:complete len:387 (+),score=47.10 Tamp_18543:80-1240(+)
MSRVGRERGEVREEERGERGERTSLEPLPHRSVMDRLIREQAMGDQATRNILAREQATGEQAAMYNLEREQAMAASEIRARTRDDSDGEEEASSRASEESEPGDPAFEGEQGLGKDGVWNIQSYIDRTLVRSTLPGSDPICVRVDLCLGNERSTLIKIKGRCSNLVVTKCCNVVLMVDEIGAACTVSESEYVSIIVRGTFPSPLTIRGVNGLHFTCVQNNVHSSLSVSRGIGVEIHGIVKAGQLEPPFPPVGKRMPIDVWGFEPLLKAAEGKTVCKVPPDGVFVVQCCRITKCADILNRECLTGEPVLMWREDGKISQGKATRPQFLDPGPSEVQAPASSERKLQAPASGERELQAPASSERAKWYGLGVDPSGGARVNQRGQMVR